MSLGQAIVPVQVVSYNIDQSDAVYFRSWDPKHAALRMVDVALASSAAPTYFPAVEFFILRLTKDIVVLMVV